MVDISYDPTAQQLFCDVSFYIFMAGIAQIVDVWIFIICTVKTLFWYFWCNKYFKDFGANPLYYMVYKAKDHH